ncbi:hypothetical protein ABZ330_33850 [Streptomyces sp. NPDC006172]|uniref:hypothetical protein n=1 Tax=Streptomyces sp. NPDC006172 TaxID=3154470 RepID=UPI0033D50DBD
MDTENLSAPSCAQPLNPRGITHIKTPQTTRYTVVGNHLAQHRQLSLVAMGLALHIQSLPDQARVDIKTLADRFPEGEIRIAAALRELKTHGYLAQVRKRLPNGRIVTHTLSYNQPPAGYLTVDSAPAARPPSAPATTDVPPPPTTPRPEPEPEPAPTPAAAPDATSEPPAVPDTTPRPEPHKPPLPAPQTPDPERARHSDATALLSTLHHRDPRHSPSGPSCTSPRPSPPGSNAARAPRLYAMP